MIQSHNIKKILRRAVQALGIIFKKFAEDSCFIRASGMAYSTILALVPLTTVVYAFGGFDNIGNTLQSALFDLILPTHQEAILNTINEFAQNSLATGALGLIIFLFTSLFLINTISRNIDYIWGSNSNLSLLRRYTLYTSVLVFGSLLIGASFTYSYAFTDILHLTQIHESAPYKKVLTTLMTWAFTFATFLVMMIIVPSIKVRFKSAFIGSLAGTVIWELMKWAFKTWASVSVRNSVIYGSLALVPLFLIWLYIAWLIVLIAVEITYYHQNEHVHIGGRPAEFPMGRKIDLGLEVFLYISRSFYERKKFPDIKRISLDLDYSPVVVSFFTDCFTRAGLLTIAGNAGDSFVPSTSLETITVKEVIAALYGSERPVMGEETFSLMEANNFTKGGFGAVEDRSVFSVISGEK